MNSPVLRLVERVIDKSDRGRPADTVLREELRSQPEISPRDAAEISRLTFAFYRWRGWLGQGQEVAEQVLQASDLSKEFASYPDHFSDADLAQKCVPSWIQGEIQIGPDLARALQSEPKLWLRARPGRGGELAKRLGHCRRLGEGPLGDTLIYRGREDLFSRPEFHAGVFELQDVSSQAISLMCAPEPGQTWWDTCAGEGGKLLHLADLMQNKGLIWASDRAEWRLRRLKRRAARAKIFNYRMALWEGGSKLPTKTRFDGILVDAPCSGTGTWQRNPHARWTLVPKDLTELAEVQRKLLLHAAAALKPGGKLIYSVCSLAKTETIQVVEALEERKLGLTPLRLANPLMPGSEPRSHLFLWPQQTGGNGMFVAAWVRPKE